MEYRIIRGSKQIGGTITEITSKKGTRIWVDFGAELPNDDAERSSDNKMIALMNNSKSKPNVVFFTHIHGDHIGLLSHIPEDVDIYIGEVSQKLLTNIHITLMNNKYISKAERDKFHREYSILNKRKNVYFYKNKQDDIYVAPNGEEIEFKALRADHSAFDAYMLRFIVDKKVLVHTGDYRIHGRLGKDLIQDIKDTFCDRKINVLFTEGTMMSRGAETVLSEEEMQMQATEYLKKYNNAFLICSSTNMESLASFYWAAIHSSREGKKKALYCNSYIKKQLQLFTKSVGEAEQLWYFKFYRSYAIEKGLEKLLKNNQTQIQYMKENGFLMIVGASDYYLELMEKFKDCEEKPVLIYSMWDGYLEKAKPYTNEGLIHLKKKAEELGYEFIQLHTSGHATAQTITEVINIIKPTDAIVPMHTENPEGFYELGLDEELKKIINCEGTNMENEDIVLSEEQLKLLFDQVASHDSRTISETLKDAFGKNELAEFRKIVLNKDNKLIALLRGNGNKIIIYFNNHKIWELSVTRENKFRVSFDYNHARYSSDWKKDLDNLMSEEIGFVISDKKNADYYQKNWEKLDKWDDEHNIGTISCVKDKFDEGFVKKTYNIFTRCIKSFFDDGTYQYIEKEWQHKLYQEKICKEKGYEIYDLEFSQPYPDKKDISKVIKANKALFDGLQFDSTTVKKQISSNEPDMLAVRYDAEKNPLALCLMEVKCTYGACEKEKSGLITHIKKMDEYAENRILQEIQRRRKTDAYDCLKQYYELGLIDYAPSEKIKDLPIEKVIVLTSAASTKDNKDIENKKKLSGALWYYWKNKNNVDYYLKKHKTNLILITGTVNDKHNDIYEYSYENLPDAEKLKEILWK